VAQMKVPEDKFAQIHADAEGPLPTVTTTWHLRNFLVYKRPHVEDFLR